MLRRTWVLVVTAALGCGVDDAPSRGRPRDGGPAPTLDAASPRDDAQGDRGAGAKGDAAPDAASGPTEGGASIDAPGLDDAGKVEAGAVGPWAAAVQVGLVEVAQGVFIRVGDGATVVAPASRNSTLLEGRAAFLRVHVRPGAGFAPRPLRAVVTLSYVDGSERRFEDRKAISGPSSTEQLDSTFNYLLPGDALQPETKLVAAVYEASGPPGPDPAMPPRFPRTGSADFGVKAGPMVMDVVLVPVKGPSGPLDDAPARRQRLESYLADVYPAQKMNIKWHATMNITSIIDYTQAFRMLGQARIADDAPAGACYHMIIAVEDSVDKYLGLGNLAGDTPGDAADRIAMTMVTDHQVDSQMDTVAHEMGHNLGRNHAPGCDAAGVDDAFPYPNTGVGVDGYSIPEMAFKSRTKFKDVMGYCYPTWISDYTWNAFAERIRIVSGFPPIALSSAGGRSLQGFYSPGGKAEWLVVPGRLVGPGVTRTATRLARVERPDGSSSLTAVRVSLLQSPAGPENGARTFAVNLPDGDVSRVDVLIDGDHFVMAPDGDPKTRPLGRDYLPAVE